jgi:hypothetical protein
MADDDPREEARRLREDAIKARQGLAAVVERLLYIATPLRAPRLPLLHHRRP